MSIEELIKERPHLESPLTFYQKVKGYLEVCKKETEEVRPEILDRVIRAFCSVFSIPYESMSFILSEVSEKGIEPVSEPSRLLRLSFFHDDMKEEEKSRALFLISKPFFLLRRRLKGQGSFMETGRCPVCGEVPSLGRITEDNRKRLLCSFCEHEGEFYRIGCPNCMNRVGDEIDILLDEDEIRVELCKRCKSYLKSVREEHILKFQNPYLADIVSLPLDVIAQSKGYVRRSPNLIGVREIR